VANRQVITVLEQAALLGAATGADAFDPAHWAPVGGGAGERAAFRFDGRDLSRADLAGGFPVSPLGLAGH
jgi:hypothetical protein